MKSFSVCLQHITKHYGTHRVFDDISFFHAQGVLGIAGPNGSGKSTLLQCLAGLQKPTSGTIAWKKENQTVSMESLKKHLGYAAPYVNLYQELSCAENLDFLLKLRGMDNRNIAVKNALQKTNICALAGQLFGNLSTGQQQRMRLAAAIIHKPHILFLDEPGSNLDKKGRTFIQSLVFEFREAGKLLIIASNNPRELQLCDKVYSTEKLTFL